MEEETEASATQVQQSLDYRRQEWHSRRKAQRQAVLNKTRVSLEEAKASEISAQELKHIIFKFKRKREVDVPVLRKLQQALLQGDKTFIEVMKHEWVLPALISALTGRRAEEALEAAGCLTNLTVTDHPTTYRVAKAAGAYLLTLVRSSSPLTQEQCLWTLGNIASDCAVCCDLLTQQGFVPVCWSAMSSPYPSTVEAAASTLSCFLRHSWSKEDVISKQNVENLLSLSKTSRVRGVYWSMFYLSCSSRFDSMFSKQEVLKLLVDRLLSLTEEEKVNVAVITPLVRFLGNVVSGSSEAAAFIVDHSGVETLLIRLLSSCHNHIIKETLWLVGNLVCRRPCCPLTSRLINTLSLTLHKANHVLHFQDNQI